MIDSDGKLLLGISPVWQSELRWETLKTAADRPAQERPGEANVGAEQHDPSLRAQRRGTMVEFLDEFERASIKFPGHRELVVAAKKAAKQLKENCWLGMLMADYDWSENGLIAAARQIQSEYWCLKYFSLFITIFSYLEPEAWHNQADRLSPGGEGTVEPEGSPAGAKEPAKGSYFAVVHTSPLAPGENSLYSVKKNDSTVIEGVKRRHLRHRVFFNEAFASITDEKRHDGYTTSHFLNRILHEHFAERIESGEIWAFIGHSDNASHFKSAQMINYWTKKKQELGLAFLRIEFGCPGHGKGPWDGLGAVLKQCVTRDTLNNKILTQSGYVTSPMEVAEHLRRKVDTDDWRAAHRTKTIKKITVLYSDHSEIKERPANGDNSFESLTGKMTSFSYLILASEQVARRERSCWCPACMLAHRRDSPQLRLATEGELHCLECDSGQRFGAPAFPWREQTVKDLGTGLAGRRKNAQVLGCALAKKIKPGEFFALQAREQWSASESVHLRPGYFWVAQAGSNFRIEVADKRMTIGGTVFSKGDLIIRIGRYFDRDVADPSGLTFEELGNL